jgi:hypothetical protein
MRNKIATSLRINWQNFDAALASIITSTLYLLLCLKPEIINFSNLDTLIGIEISSLIGLMGFLLAVGAIIFSFKGNRNTELLQRKPAYKELIIFYYSAIEWMGLWSILEIFSLLINIQDEYKILIILGSLVFAVVKTVRALDVTKKLFLIAYTTQN